MCVDQNRQLVFFRENNTNGINIRFLTHVTYIPLLHNEKQSPILTGDNALNLIAIKKLRGARPHHKIQLKLPLVTIASNGTQDEKRTTSS